MNEDIEICECGKTYNPDECYGYCHDCLSAWFAAGCPVEG